MEEGVVLIVDLAGRDLNDNTRGDVVEVESPELARDADLLTDEVELPVGSEEVLDGLLGTTDLAVPVNSVVIEGYATRAAIDVEVLGHGLGLWAEPDLGFLSGQFGNMHMTKPQASTATLTLEGRRIDTRWAWYVVFFLVFSEILERDIVPVIAPPTCDGIEQVDASFAVGTQHPVGVQPRITNLGYMPVTDQLVTPPMSFLNLAKR